MLSHLLLIQPSSVLKKVYPKVIWHFEREKKVIYLTFDDGPVPGLTEWVLDQLEHYKAKATFFCVGANIHKNRDIFERIKKEGHAVGNHTMFHPRGFKQKVKNYMAEADECRNLVNNNLFRPPYGQLRPSQYKELIRKNYRIILWDVISYDYENITPEKCTDNVLKNTRNGSIVLFHDNIKAETNIKFALPQFLEYFSTLGFGFEPIMGYPN